MRWVCLTAALGLAPGATAETYRALIKAYGSAGRYYHNLEHLECVLGFIEQLQDEACHPNLVNLAGWFHDAIHDTHAGDNEERSAILAQTTCANWRISENEADRVAELIRATRTHQAAEDDHDASVLLDADLSILGATEVAYDAYASAIRQEYSWVSDADFRAGRARVLRSFLERERLFRLERMRRQYEEQARYNLAREIERISG